MAAVTNEICQETYPDLRSTLDEAYQLWRARNVVILQPIEAHPDYRQVLDKAVADERKFQQRHDRAVCEIMATAFYNNAWPLTDSSPNTELGVIGLELNRDPKEEFARVVRAVAGYDAHKQGIQAEDRIVAVDGVSMRNRELSAISSRLRGPAGTKVTVTVVRTGVEAPITFQLTRLAWK